jgi:hypothetical protein
MAVLQDGWKKWQGGGDDGKVDGGSWGFSEAEAR